MTNIPVSVQLDLAADAIQMAGWATGPKGWPGIGGDGDGLCLEGGLMVALGLEDSERGRLYMGCPAYQAMREYLGRHFLFFWNDEEGRTQQEVIEVLRAAAAVERTKEAIYETGDQPLPLEVA